MTYAINTYECSYFGKCPLDNETIQYLLKIETTETIVVEHITTFVKTIGGLLHEEQADALATVFRGKQTLVATHQGVLITTVRDDA